MKVIESASLSFQEGNSDKVYNVRLERNGSSHAVHFSYGRRGGTMNEGYKVQDTDEATARREFDKLVASKVKKGYRHA